MKWIELSVKTPPEFVDPLSHIFYRYGHGGVAIEQDQGFNPDEGESPSITSWVTVKTYLPVNSTTEDRRSRIDLGVRLVSHVAPISELEERLLAEEEWQHSWKEHFYVLHIGKRVVIRPTWREYDSKESDVVISLDPGMAFGTGHHPTTRMCLEQLEQLVEPGMDILDFGCGSGILSIAASKLGAKSVIAIEIDSVAMKAANQNSRLNGTDYNIRLIQGSLPNAEIQSKRFDIIVANISAKVISEAATSLIHAVKTEGKLIVSGILLANKDEVEKALTLAGGNMIQSGVEGDWVTLVFTHNLSGSVSVATHK